MVDFSSTSTILLNQFENSSCQSTRQSETFQQKFLARICSEPWPVWSILGVNDARVRAFRSRQHWTILTTLNWKPRLWLPVQLSAHTNGNVCVIWSWSRFTPSSKMHCKHLWYVGAPNSTGQCCWDIRLLLQFARHCDFILCNSLRLAPVATDNIRSTYIAFIPFLNVLGWLQEQSGTQVPLGCHCSPLRSAVNSAYPLQSLLLQACLKCSYI